MFREISFMFLFLTFIAEVLGTIGGFGSSVFFVPIANFYFDFKSVLGLTALFHVASNLSKISLFRKGLDKHLLLYMGVPAIIFVILGGFLTKWIDTSVLEGFLGFSLIGLSLLFLLFPSLKIKKGDKEAISGGALSGFLAGLLGTGGAVRGLTMAAFDIEKNAFIATSAFIDFGVDFSRMIVYFFNGYMHIENAVYVPFLIIIGFIGTYFGKIILQFIPQERFKQLSLFLIIFIGIITVLKVLGWIKLSIN